jgi:hypothetical protein
MEDDLRKEYDLKSLTVRKLGSGRKTFGGREISNNIEHEIDILISVFENYFVSKRTGTQKQLIFLKNTTNWKKHRKYFQIGIIISLILFFAFLKATVDFSRSGNIQNYRFVAIILIFSTLFFLLAFVMCMSLAQFVWIWETFRTYQDELHDIRKNIKKNAEKINYLNYGKAREKRLPEFVFFITKIQFEYRIKRIEDGLKVIDTASYMYAILWLLSILLVFGFPQSFSSLLGDSKNYSLLLSVFVFAVVTMQSVLKTVAYSSGYSQIKKHQECLVLLKEMEVMIDSIEEINPMAYQLNIQGQNLS